MSDELPIIKPFSVNVQVTYRLDRDTHDTDEFEDVGDIVEDMATGALTVQDRHGFTVAKYHKDQWTRVWTTDYSEPGDHVETEEKGRGWR